MRTIDPYKLRDYIDKRIYKYDTLSIEPMELDAVVGYVEYNDTVVVRVNDRDEIVDIHLPEVIFFETLDDAQTKQALDVYNLYKGRYQIEDKKATGAIEYYKRFIDEADFEFFLQTATNYQLTEEEYNSIIKKIFEKNPEYLI